MYRPAADISRQTDLQAVRHTDEQTNRQTDEQSNRQTAKQTAGLIQLCNESDIKEKTERTNFCVRFRIPECARAKHALRRGNIFGLSTTYRMNFIVNTSIIQNALNVWLTILYTSTIVQCIYVPGNYQVFSISWISSRLPCTWVATGCLQTMRESTGDFRIQGQ